MKRHPLDVFSLFAGLLFTGLGVAFLLDALDQWSADLGWVPPIVLIVLGIGGIASTVGRREPQPAVVDATAGATSATDPAEPTEVLATDPDLASTDDRDGLGEDDTIRD